MKPRIGVYLSKRAAARLATAAKRRGTTKSALVEAAIDHFLDSEEGHDAVPLADRLTELTGQIGQLDRDLGIVSEIVALHARFHLAVTPELPDATQDIACKRGAARFNEFASQVERRLQQGTSLMQETIDRLDTSRSNPARADLWEGRPPFRASSGHDANLRPASLTDEMSEHTAAVREDGSSAYFPGQQRRPMH